MTADVGIVGFGRCGRLAAEVLADGRRVAVTDPRDRRADAEALGVEWADLDGVASRPVVLLAVPIRAIPEILDDLAPRLAPGAVVVDMASVKTKPMAWMEERLPGSVSFVGTHPLFGPDSVRERGLEGQAIAITPARGHEAAAERVTAAARALGLRPVVTTPEDHDRQMARSQALVFLVARSIRAAGLDAAELGTPSEHRVSSALRLVDADSRELYEDILTLNPWAAEALTGFRDALGAEVDRLLGG